MRGLSIVASGY